MRFTKAGSGTQVAASGEAQVVGTPVAAGAGAVAADEGAADELDGLEEGGPSPTPLAPSGEVAGRGDPHDVPAAPSTTSSRARPERRGSELRMGRSYVPSCSTVAGELSCNEAHALEAPDYQEEDKNKLADGATRTRRTKV
jgi:hypothetical protein